jgi:hypothetical protein
MTEQDDTLDLSASEDERDASFVEAVDTAISARLALVNTSMPATVLKYDRATQRATVQPAVNVRLPDGTTAQPPAITGAPVAFPGSGPHSITWDLEPGDTVLLVVSQQSLADWMARGGYGVAASDPRRFAAEDAVVLPGLRPSKGQLAAPAVRAATLVIANGDQRVELRADGVVTVFGSEVRLGDDTAEALALAAATQSALDDLWTAMVALYTWGAGVTPPLPAGPVFPATATAPDVATAKTKGT